MTYVSEKSHLDYSAKEKEIKETIDTLQEKNLIFQILKKTLQKFEGKKITKRITYDLKAAGYTTHYEKEKWGTITLHVWGNDIPYGERLWFTFPESAAEDFKLETFLKGEKYLDQQVLTNIEQYEQVLADLPGLVVEYNMRVDFFNEALREVNNSHAAMHPHPSRLV